MQKYSISHFRKQFPNDATCLAWLAKEHYPDGIECPKCKKVTKHHAMKTPAETRRRRSYAKL